MRQCHYIVTLETGTVPQTAEDYEAAAEGLFHEFERLIAYPHSDFYRHTTAVECLEVEARLEGPPAGITMDVLLKLSGESVDFDPEILKAAMNKAAARTFARGKISSKRKVPNPMPVPTPPGE